MSDRVALIVGILIVAAVLWDLIFNGGSVSFFLAQKGVNLIEWMAFWR